MGRQTLKRRCKAEEVMQGSARAEEKRGNFLQLPVKEESFEGSSPGASGAERGFHGLKSWYHREGSQTLGMGLLGSGATLPRRFLKRGVKRRGFQPWYAEGQESLGEGHAEHGSRSTWDMSRDAAPGRERRWGGVEGQERKSVRDFNRFLATARGEDPKIRENLRMKGEEASHELLRSVADNTLKSTKTTRADLTRE
jgi:hypothetical protein